jgi:cytochrome P450
LTVEYEPLSPRWRADPYPKYRELRDRDPVHWAPESRCWCVSRYDDVLFVLKQPDLFSSRAMFTMLMNGGQESPPPLSWAMVRFIVRFLVRTRMNPFAFPKARNLIAADPPVHGEMRNTVSRGFTPGVIRSWEPRIREIVERQTEKLRSGESFDVMRDLAIPLPVTIIAEMIGVEPDRTADFKRWSDAIIEGATGGKRTQPFHPEIVEAILELDGYLGRTIRERRRRPGNDLVSTIIREEPGGAPLSDMEVAQFVQLLMVAGNETTTNLIGNAVNALLDHPSELERIAGNPGLIPDLIEETLRWDAPIQILFRRTTRDVEVAGTRIPEGAIVAPILGSANRDERHFPEPERFDPSRSTRGHLGFGFGQHFCLGASLARLEAKAALESLIPELPRLKRETERREMVDSFLVRGPTRLELRRVA